MGNHMTQQVYNAALEKGLIDYTSAQFIVNGFHALKKITPANTLIVPGQPSTAAGATHGSVFYGADAADPYNAMARAYAELVNEPQFGGAMTWEVSADKSNGWKFADTIYPAVSGSRALAEKPKRF